MHLNFPYVIIFKKVALYLKNISLSGWIWRILPKKRKTRLLEGSIFRSVPTLTRRDEVSVFFKVYFMICLSALEKKVLVSGRRTPAGLGHPSEHHLPPPPRSVPFGLLTLSTVSPVRVLLAKDRACSSACRHSDAISQQPTKSNAEHGPVLQRFLELWRPLSLYTCFFLKFEELYPSKLVSSLTFKAFLPLNWFPPGVLHPSIMKIVNSNSRDISASPLSVALGWDLGTWLRTRPLTWSASQVMRTPEVLRSNS